MTDTRPIGIIGVGELGTVVANALLGVGQKPVGFDPQPGAAARMEAIGVRMAASPAALGGECGIVIVTVATAVQASDVLAGPDGVFATMSAGTVVLHATIDPATSVAIASRKPNGVTFVDAPVSVRRSQPPTFMAFVGMARDLDPELRAVLETYCHDLAYIGPVGAGQAAKIVNNVMSLVNTAVASEALRLAAAYGIGVERMRELASRGSGASHALATWDTRASLFDHSSGDIRRQSLAKKDLVAAIALAESAGLDMAVTAAALRQLST